MRRRWTDRASAAPRKKEGTIPSGSRRPTGFQPAPPPRRFFFLGGGRSSRHPAARAARPASNRRRASPGSSSSAVGEGLEPPDRSPGLPCSRRLHSPLCQPTWAPRPGLEPGTVRLTGGRSAIELPGNGAIAARAGCRFPRKDSNPVQELERLRAYPWPTGACAARVRAATPRRAAASLLPGSNRPPAPYKGAALPDELRRRTLHDRSCSGGASRVVPPPIRRRFASAPGSSSGRLA